MTNKYFKDGKLFTKSASDITKNTNILTQSEIQLQAACFKWACNETPIQPGLLFAVPNGGKRSQIEASQLKASGTIAGIPDMILIWKCRPYGFELKTDKGVVSPAQKKIHTLWIGAGIPVYIIRSLEDFQNAIFAIIS